MLIYISCSQTETLEYIDGGHIGYTQDQLEDIYYKYDINNNPYELAEIFTEQKATKDNYFINSIGYWTDTRFSMIQVPHRKPDYISKSGSKYWYTANGVFRRSDHWGEHISSCSWFIDCDSYYDPVVIYDKPVNAFIKWDDLKARGEILYNRRTETYSLYGFNFDNKYYH